MKKLNFLIVSLVVLCGAVYGSGLDNIRTELVPLQTKFVLGKSMKFRVKVTNTGHSIVSIGEGMVTTGGDTFSIIGSDGQRLPHNPMGKAIPLFLVRVLVAPRETKFIGSERNINDEYPISKAGVYKIQYVAPNIPPSNSVKITVK